MQTTQAMFKRGSINFLQEGKAILIGYKIDWHIEIHKANTLRQAQDIIVDLYYKHERNGKPLKVSQLSLLLGQSMRSTFKLFNRLNGRLKPILQSFNLAQ